MIDCRTLCPSVRRCLLPLLLLLMTVSLSACADVVRDDGQAALSYADTAFSADIRGSVCRTEPDGYAGPPGLPGESRTDTPWEIAARVTLSAPDAAGRRTASVTYTAPSALAGLTVTRTTPDPSDPTAGPAITLSLGDLTFTDDTGAYDGLLFPADALIPSGDITSSGRDANGLFTVTLTHPTDPAAATRCLTFADGVLPVRAVMTDRKRTVTLLVSSAP